MLFRVLGDLVVETGDGHEVALSARMRRVLLGMLLASPNRVASADELAEGLWGDDQPRAAEPALRVHVSRLRADLGEDGGIVVTRPPGYLARVGPDELDAQVFERLVDEGDRALSDGATGVAADRYATGLDLWRGAAFEPFTYEPWAQPEIRRLTERRWFAVEQRIEAELQLGRHSQLVPELESIVADQPLRERLWGHLMLALYRSGRQGDALRAFTRARDTLVDELGIDPSRELQDLERNILDQDESIAAVSVTPAAAALLDVAVLAAHFPTTSSDHQAIRSSVETAVMDARGEIVESRDNAIIASLPQAVDAIQAAVGVSEAANEDDRPRLGIDIASVERTNSGIKGLGVHRALRIAGLADWGQVLVSSTASERIRSSELSVDVRLIDIGNSVLPGVTDPVRLFEVAIPGAKPPAPKASQPRRTNLPAQLTSFVGRAADLDDLLGVASDHRLVTVTGPGGAGKTRLALQAAADLVGQHRDGVWLIALGSVTEPRLIPSAFEQALGLELPSDVDTLSALVEALASREVLLVVDNCEHVIDDAAGVVQTLLAGGPEIRVLATSREPLGIPGEREWRTPVLAVPDPRRLPSVEDLSRVDAVGLFVERARDAHPHFKLTPYNAPSVIGICSEVDGLPLAIEIVAAHLRHRSIQEIESGLRAVLASRSPFRTVPDRQRTLEATTGWSYEILSADEQALFRQLSVFPDTFSRESVLNIASIHTELDSGIPGLLDRLLDKSLVAIADSLSDERRYRLLSTVHAFATDRLSQAPDSAGETSALRSRHAAFYADWSESAYEHTGGAEQALWLDRQGSDQGNAIAAIRWALDEGHVDIAARIAASYGWYWLVRGPRSAGRDLVEEVIHAGADHHGDTGRQLLMSAGYLCGELGDVNAAQRYLEAKLAADEAASDVVAMAGTLSNLGLVVDRTFDHRAALRHANQAIALATSEPFSDDVRDKLVSLHTNAATTHRQMGNVIEARRNIDQAERFSRDGGHRYAECRAILGGVQLDIDSLDLDVASTRLDEAGDIAESIRDSVASQYVLMQRSRIFTHRGRLAEARMAIDRAWEISVESGDRSRLPELADQAAVIAIGAGDWPMAADFAAIAAVQTESAPRRVPGLQLLAYIAAEAGEVEEATALLGQAAALQARRGCITTADLAALVASTEAICRDALGA